MIQSGRLSVRRVEMRPRRVTLSSTLVLLCTRKTKTTWYTTDATWPRLEESWAANGETSTRNRVRSGQAWTGWDSKPKPPEKSPPSGISWLDITYGQSTRAHTRDIHKLSHNCLPLTIDRWKSRCEMPISDLQPNPPYCFPPSDVMTSNCFDIYHVPCDQNNAAVPSPSRRPAAGRLRQSKV